MSARAALRIFYVCVNDTCKIRVGNKHIRSWIRVYLAYVIVRIKVVER